MVATFRKPLNLSICENQDVRVQIRLRRFAVWPTNSVTISVHRSRPRDAYGSAATIECSNVDSFAM